MTGRTTIQSPALAAARCFAAGIVAWAMLFCAWLLLGSAGRWLGPARIGGFAPLALWLLVAGCAAYASRSMRWAGMPLRAIVLGAGLVTTTGLHWVSASGNLAALCIAAGGWGVLLVASAGVLRSLRPTTGSDTAMFAAAAAGAALAWMLAGDLPSRPAPAMVYGPLLAAVALAALASHGGAARRHGPGPLDCALPGCAGVSWRSPRGFALACARWTMLPMMASLVPMAEWCSAGSRDPVQIVGMHLAAMLLPPLLWQAVCRRPPSLLSVALPMTFAASLYAWASTPAEWTVAALLQSMGWGLAWSAMSAQRAASGPSAPAAGHAGWQALLPAAFVAALGIALAAYGPAALRLLLFGLAVVTAAGALVASLRPQRMAAGASS